ncbi:MAG: peptide-methionine (S)-S-oxide reductase MsrA [Methylococcaceae bacterium]|nr:peptide-methionine (S)-S-oxide reductase MsrA [Methylococcaceae bacterium]
MKLTLSWLIFMASLSVMACNAQQNLPITPMAKLGNLSVATFAGGCFWCTESDFEKLTGVQDAISGFSGGHVANPSYDEVSSGTTGHVESVQVYYDPKIISYTALLDAFWRMVNPTDKGGQFVDRGEQYRSLIFYQNEAEQLAAEQSRRLLNESKRYSKPVITEIKKFEAFYPAEDYHQNYYKNNPIRYQYYRFRSGRDQYLEEIWGADLQGKVKQEKTSTHNNKPDGVILR